MHEEELIDKWDLTMQCVQLYQNTILDLIAPRIKEKLKIRTNFDDNSTYVQGLTSVSCNTLHSVLDEIKKCKKRRYVSNHKLNATSSRSHIVSLIFVAKCDSENGGG